MVEAGIRGMAVLAAVPQWQAAMFLWLGRLHVSHRLALFFRCDIPGGALQSASMRRMTCMCTR